MTKSYRVAVVGATGAVGREIVSLLEERNFPISKLVLLASRKSEGSVINFSGQEISIHELTENSFENVDIALFSAGGSVSQRFCPVAVESGAVCVDNTSVFRMEKDVPLVVAEVNPEDIFEHKGVIANPNCSTIQMVVALYPIHKAFGIKRIIVSTYQSVSGAGNKGIMELEQQLRDFCDNKELRHETFCHPIALNCLPHIDVFTESGFTKEELKMIYETRKILKDAEMAISVTTVRVPVLRSHSESVHIELEKKTSSDEIRSLLQKSVGVEVLDRPENNIYPLAFDAIGKDAVFVGRIREDFSVKNSYHLWIVSDNLRKGAALNTVQIAEILCEGMLGKV